MRATRDHAGLDNALLLLARFHQFSQCREGEQATFQPPLRDRPFLIHEQIAPLGFVLVLGQLRATQELLRVLAPLGHGLEKGHPGLVKLDEHLIAHFTRKGLIGFMGLDLLKNLDMIEIDALVNEGLTHHVVGGVPEIF